MFRFYSVCAPNGTPDAAALRAAEELPHQWDNEDGAWKLSVLGMRSSEIVFFYGKDALFLCEPAFIAKVALPPPNIGKFFFEPWTPEELRMGSQLVKFGHSLNPESWVKANGEPVDLAKVDEKVFGKGKKKELPVVSFGQNGMDTIVLIPEKLVDYLKKTQGPLRAKASIKTGGQKIVVCFSAEKNDFLTEIEVLNPIDPKNKNQKLHVIGGGKKNYLPFFFEGDTAAEWTLIE